jgi:hydroxymethylpyrimidine pyrophosphatase-like HAD family hydrolase
VTVRLVATDIDGTLLRSDGTPSAATVSALQRLSVPYVLVTGRPQRWIEHLATEIGHAGVAIAVNGALTYDLATGDVIRVRELAPTVMRAAAAAIRAVVPDALFGAERRDGMWREVGYPVRETGFPPTVDTFDGVISSPALKLLCRSASVDGAEQLYEVAAAACAGLDVELTHSSGSFGLLEISATGVDKATALAAHCADLGIHADDVLAFGDGFNDLAMVTWAGRGVAVANAHPALLAAADEITASNDDDGVATVLGSLAAQEV